MGSRTDIIEHNLELMNSLKKCGMFKALNLESTGSRGYVEIRGQKCPLVFVNFCYDPLTGFINCFTNYAREASEGFVMATFRFAAHFKNIADTKYNPYFKIIGVTLDDSTSKEANKVLQTCIMMYNDIFDKD